MLRAFMLVIALLATWPSLAAGQERKGFTCGQYMGLYDQGELGKGFGVLYAAGFLEGLFFGVGVLKQLEIEAGSQDSPLAASMERTFEPFDVTRGEFATRIALRCGHRSDDDFVVDVVADVGAELRVKP